MRATLTTGGLPQTQAQPDSSEPGYFGPYGGSFVSPGLLEILKQIEQAWKQAAADPQFHRQVAYYRRHYVGRPSPVYHCERLSRELGGAQIYLKREDLNHTGAHKINHCLCEALLARRLGKRKVIAETGAGSHGVALATAAALLGLECDIYMGEVDMERERPNVVRMHILGARVIPVTHGLKTLKEAVDAAYAAYEADPHTQFYAIGSVLGPHPFPSMVREFQRIVGEESRAQMLELTGRLPDALVACVGGGSNAMGLFAPYLGDPGVEIYGVEPAGTGLKTGEHAASLRLGTVGVIHGFKCYVLQDEAGEAAPVYSIAAGLDYPGVGPEHCYLKDAGRVRYEVASDEEAVEAFFRLSRAEGIIPALESAHAVAWALKMAPGYGKDKTILVNLSGRGDKDIDYVIGQFGPRYGIGQEPAGA